ncbi:MAG: glutamyl-tRNA reductase [Actinobacteria bacterium]|jgi:glutamyl-tRNA reductase|nr:glutamyl-tRNA reductase [Actinomycetota bacterium]
MSIVVLGINYHTSPVTLLEKVMIPVPAMSEALRVLSSHSDIREVIVLSTCNRTEVYAVAERYHAAHTDILEFLCETSGLSADEITPHLYSQFDDDAVVHLFEVAAGIDSAVLGETEIVGQVRDAWDFAMKQGTSRSTLNLLFRYALESGKRARTETGISRSTASVAHAAVEMAEEILGTLSGKRVLVVGAGEMGEGVAGALSRAGTESITVLNRTVSRAEALADKIGARVSDFESLENELSTADVVLACTGAGGVIIDHELLARVRQGVSTPILVVDIALPRDVAASVAELPGVTLRDLDNLSDWAQRGIDKRASEVGQVREIIGEEVKRFLLDQTQRQAAPLVAQLREVVESIRTAEMDRFETALSAMTPEQRELVESISHGIINKMLHVPSVRLREAAGTPQGERLSAAVRDLFSLD